MRAKWGIELRVLAGGRAVMIRIEAQRLPSAAKVTPAGLSATALAALG